MDTFDPFCTHRPNVFEFNSVHMPRYYCDYCDVYLTHDSHSVRRTHNEGWKHKEAVREFYSQFLPKINEHFTSMGLSSDEIRRIMNNAASYQPYPVRGPPLFPGGPPPPFGRGPPPFAGGGRGYPPPPGLPPGVPPSSFPSGPPPFFPSRSYNARYPPPNHGGPPPFGGLPPPGGPPPMFPPPGGQPPQFAPPPSFGAPPPFHHQGPPPQNPPPFHNNPNNNGPFGPPPLLPPGFIPPGDAPPPLFPPPAGTTTNNGPGPNNNY